MNLYKKMHIKSDDLEYMNTTQAAMLMNGGKYTRAIIWVFFIFILTLIVWAYYAKIDKMTRGMGKVVPSLELQYIQSYDGGIISEIFVHDGDIVHRGDKIVRIDDTDFRSKYMSGEVDLYALTAKMYRLEAEAQGIPFFVKKVDNEKLALKIALEKQLYSVRQKTLEKKISILREKAIQKESELKTVNIEIENLTKSLKLAQETVEITKRMLKHKVVSKMQYNEQLRQKNNIEGDLESKKSLVPKIASEIKALQEEILHTRLSFQSKSQEELEKVRAKLAKLNESKNIDQGRVKRAVILSPINGTIKKMHYNTLGGVVKPGGVIAEVVPTEEHLIIDTKITPDDIAFIYTGQNAVVRFSAYDFATYGALQGKVISISADTTIDEIDKKHYYTVKIKTDKNYLEQGSEHFPIKIGMVAIIDIMNGKQSVFDYILSPIIRAKQNMFSNH